MSDILEYDLKFQGDGDRQYVFYVKNEYIGHAYISSRGVFQNNKYYLEELYVDSCKRNYGYGRDILFFLLKRYYHKGIAWYSTQYAKSFYEHLGFVGNKNNDFMVRK